MASSILARRRVRSEKPWARAWERISGDGTGPLERISLRATKHLRRGSCDPAAYAAPHRVCDLLAVLERRSDRAAPLVRVLARRARRQRPPKNSLFRPGG